jgi:hypothetical protein
MMQQKGLFVQVFGGSIREGGYSGNTLLNFLELNP